MAQKIRLTCFVDESSQNHCSCVEEHNIKKHCHMSHTDQSHPRPPCGSGVLPERGLLGLVGGGGQALGCSLLLFAAGFGVASVPAFVLAFRVIRCPSFLFGAAFSFGFGSFA